jgi:hypothetical protein
MSLYSTEEMTLAVIASLIIVCLTWAAWKIMGDDDE